MVKALVLAAVAWPFVLGGAVVARAHDAAPAFVTTVYVVAARVCHQRPERSFHSDGVKWPVCARCSGLYLGGAAGALVWLVMRRRPVPRPLVWLAVAAAPTALTVVLEWTGLAGVGNAARALAGIPLGAVIALVIVNTAADESFSPRSSRSSRS